MLPSVAVCIPTYNQASYLPLAVASAASQDYSGPTEIWVGDDASTDRTDEVLEGLSSEILDLRVVRQPTNVGIPTNCSRLMRQPDADYLVRLDSDDELEPGFLTGLVDAMEAHPGAGYGHSAITQIDQAGAMLDVRRLLRGSGYQGPDSALRASLSGYRTVANILIFRREILESLDFYEGRPAMRQDYDLAVRIADSGYGNVYVDETLARYRVWTDTKGVRAKRKGLELEGYKRIFDEVFAPAWRRRTWNPAELARQRRKLALHHCAACFAPQYSPAERTDLIKLLRDLGDSQRLSFWIWICRHGGAPWLVRISNLRYRVKSIAKTTLKSIRNRRFQGKAAPV